ncbi:MAG: VWA domain-containing protein [Chloroflexi bacterium]|nr:VWA domain-containing protein [Chloroflexota bacterium]
MPYTVPATSKTPALIIYLLDVSGSMGEPLGGKPKIEVVSDALHQVAVRMVQRSTKGTTVAPRYRVAMFAYSSQVTDLLGGIKTVSELAQMGVPRLQPMDATDTASAFREAENLLNQEIGNLQDSPAPLVCHMTDGEYNSGGDPEPIAKRIMQMAVPDGNVLIENIFVTDKATSAPISDPKNWDGITDETPLASPYAETLMRMSSEVPPTYASVMAEMGYRLSPGARMLFPGNTPEIVELGFAMSGATPVSPVSP